MSGNSGHPGRSDHPCDLHMLILCIAWGERGFRWIWAPSETMKHPSDHWDYHWVLHSTFGSEELRVRVHFDVTCLLFILLGEPSSTSRHRAAAQVQASVDRSNAVRSESRRTGTSKLRRAEDRHLSTVAVHGMFKSHGSPSIWKYCPGRMVQLVDVVPPQKSTQEALNNMLTIYNGIYIMVYM